MIKPIAALMVHTAWAVEYGMSIAEAASGKWGRADRTVPKLPELYQSSW